MKKIILTTLFIFSVSYSQNVEISSDGKLINKYTKTNIDLIKTLNPTGDVPYGTTPDWQNTLYRQAGGITWGDYDGDGDLDLAVGNYFSQSYPPVTNYENLIFRNDNGVLTADPVWISSDMKSTTDVKFADVNGDGRIDLLSCNGSSSFEASAIYLNSASGLPSSPSMLLNNSAWSVGSAFGDVDGDGDLDIAFGNQGVSPTPNKPIAVFHNTNGSYPSTPSWISADQMITNSVAWGDLNNSDITSGIYEYTAVNNGYAIHLPNMPVVKVDSITISGSKISGFWFDMVSGIVSLGRKTQAGQAIKVYYKYIKKGDLAAAKWVNFSSGVYMNDNGVLQQTATWTTGTTEGRKGCAWGDYNNDGYLDLAIGGSSNPTIVYKNTNGVLGSSPVWSSNSSSTSSQEVAWADVNNDGWLDLAVAHFSPKKVEIFLNRAGILDAGATWTYITPNGCNCLAFGDLNGDGYPDLAIGTAAQPAMVFINKSNPQICKEVNINEGWNMVSIPVNSENMTPQGLFPSAISPAYYYDNGYMQADTLKNGKGYWLKFSSAQTVNLCGTSVNQANISIKAGWNMIGGYDKDIPVNQITTSPPGILNSQFYQFSNGYLPSDTLKAGKGYWIKSTTDGVIIIPAK